jgi:hypothetical protein
MLHIKNVNLHKELFKSSKFLLFCREDGQLIELMHGGGESMPCMGPQETYKDSGSSILKTPMQLMSHAKDLGEVSSQQAQIPMLFCNWNNVCCWLVGWLSSYYSLVCYSSSFFHDIIRLHDPPVY